MICFHVCFRKYGDPMPNAKTPKSYNSRFPCTYELSMLRKLKFESKNKKQVLINFCVRKEAL